MGICISKNKYNSNSDSDIVDSNEILSMENIVENNSKLKNNENFFRRININEPFLIEFYSDNKNANDILAFYGNYSHIRLNNNNIILYSKTFLRKYYKQQEDKYMYNHTIETINLKHITLASWNYYLTCYNIYIGNSAINKWNGYEFLCIT